VPSNLRIVHLRHLLRFTAQGEIDYPELKKAVKEIALVPGAFVEYDVLVDTRGSELHLSAGEIWNIASDLAEAVHASPSKGFIAKVAVICPVDRFDYAKLFELCAQNRGLNVRAFTRFEDVFDWLSQLSSSPQGNSS